MSKSAALFLIACGLHTFGCSGDLAVKADELIASKALAQAQVLPDVPTGPPAASGQIASTVQAPIEQPAGAVTPRAGTKVIQVRVENVTGTGCTSELTQVEAGKVFADSIRLVFDEDFFRLFAAKAPNRAGEPKSLHCVIELRVRGVPGLEAAVHQVNYRGSSNLPAFATGRINSRILWRDDEFESDGAEGNFERPGPWEGPWIYDHQVNLSTKASRSRCFTSEQQEDIAYIELTSTLQNNHPTMDALFEVTHTYALASDVLPKDQLGPPLEYRIAAVPCTP